MSQKRNHPIDLKPRQLPLGLLVESEWNPNRVPPSLLSKIRRSIVEFGVVENLVARPHPSERGVFEVLSGNQRLRVLRELGHASAPVVVVELPDAPARVLAQILNRTRGSDDPTAYAALLERILSDFDPARVAEFLPETEATLDRILRQFGSNPQERTPSLEPPAAPRSKPGELYELGQSRLLCADSTDREVRRVLFDGVSAALMLTDPPYSVGVDHRWRDGVRQPAGSARTATLLNDDRCDWREAYLLTDAPVAYVWHSALHGGVVAEGLAAAGFVVRQQIIWVKQIHALSRAHYQWRHEPCWYAVRKGAKASWQGGSKQTTVWEAASPIAGFGSGGAGEDAVTPHPTQKPLELFERPLLNHTRPGEVVYDPFCGSGTCLIAAEKHGRRCFAVELDPAWCDVIRDRYERFAAGGGL